MRTRCAHGPGWPVGLIIVLTGLAQPAVAGEPLHDHDNGPLTGFFGIPDSTEGAVLLEPGEMQTGAMVLVSSHSVNDERHGEEIILDGETTRLEFTFRRGLRSGLELAVEVPYLGHASGSLDSAVDNWHRLLGLSGGFRDDRPEDRIEFLYTDADGVQFDFSRNVAGFGDVRLLAGWRFYASARHFAALRLGVKLPTGDSEKLLGSGGTDVSLGLAGDLAEPLGLPGLSAFYRVGVVYIGKHDVLPERSRKFVGHLAFGLGQQLTRRLELRLQAALRGPPYDAEVEPLGDPSGTLTFGGNIRLSPRWRMGLAVTEDVKVRSAPDVSFQANFSYAAGSAASRP